VNGKKFIGMPESGTQLFVEDVYMQERILQHIMKEEYLDKAGNPGNIDFILFPGF
jgi:hypothetical protein